MKDLNPPVVRTPYHKEDPENEPLPDAEVMWVCEACGKDKLGIVRDQQLFVKYRERSVVFQGVVRMPCRFCNYENVMDTRDTGISLNIIHSDDPEPVFAESWQQKQIEKIAEEEKPEAIPKRKKRRKKS